MSGLPVLSSSHVTLGEWVERVQQLRDINSLLWTNMAVSSVAAFRYYCWKQSVKLLCSLEHGAKARSVLASEVSGCGGL